MAVSLGGTSDLDNNKEEYTNYTPTQISEYRPYEYETNLKCLVNLNIDGLDRYNLKIYNKDNNKLVREIETTYSGNKSDYQYYYNKELNGLEYEIPLPEGEYKIDLVVKLQNKNSNTKKEYVLNTLDVSIIEGKEVTVIRNNEDYKKIQPDGNYFVLNDLDLSNNINYANKYDAQEYKFGNNTIPFNGSIDFNGKTVKREIRHQGELYTNDSDKVDYFLFYKLSETAVIKNINMLTGIISDDNLSIKTNSILVYLNYGTISNIHLTLEKCSKARNYNIGLIGYKNLGILENFVIKLESSFYLGDSGALGFYSCDQGIIRNGYIFTPKSDYSISAYKVSGGLGSLFDQPLDYRKNLIAPLVAYVKNESTIQNIFSTVTVSGDLNEAIEER